MNFFYNKNYVGAPYGDLGNDPPTILWVISAYLLESKNALEFLKVRYILNYKITSLIF